MENNKSRGITNAEFEKYEEEQKYAAQVEAIKAGCLTREMANTPGGRAALGYSTLKALEEYAAYRAGLK